MTGMTAFSDAPPSSIWSKRSGVPRNACLPGGQGAQAVRSRPAGRVPADAVLNELVALAVHGDREATEKLLATARAMVLPYCRARLGGQQFVIDSAEDVAQDVCLAVLTTLARYQLRGLSFRAFLYGIAAHKVTDAYRAAARHRFEPIADFDDATLVQDGPEQLVLLAEQSEWLNRLLAVLSDRQREIVVLRFVVGLSAAETAQIVGSTPGAVRVLQHRALGQLRVALAKEHPEHLDSAVFCGAR